MGNEESRVAAALQMQTLEHVLGDAESRVATALQIHTKVSQESQKLKTRKMECFADSVGTVDFDATVARVAHEF